MRNALLTVSFVYLSATSLQTLAADAPPAVPQAAITTQTPPPPPARGPALDVALEAARTAVQTCLGLEQKVGVSVVDSGGVLKVLLATDGASARGVQNSTLKAQTALTFNAATSQIAEQIKTDKTLADKIAANPNYVGRAGGILIKLGTEVIGAIGVGGARGSEKDETCALAALDKVKSRLN